MATRKPGSHTYIPDGLQLVLFFLHHMNQGPVGEGDDVIIMSYREKTYVLFILHSLLLYFNNNSRFTILCVCEREREPQGTVHPPHYRLILPNVIIYSVDSCNY